MSTKKHIRTAMIGCGQIALSGHLPALLAHRAFELVALCDVKPESLNAAAELVSRAGRALPRMEQDYRALLATDELDACVLALHPEHSVTVAIDAIQRGIAVLDEKPLAATLEVGARLVEAVQATRGIYQTGFCFRYAPAIDLLAQWCRQIGAPQLIQAAIYDERPSQHDPAMSDRMQRTLAESSAMNHEGSHVLDWMARLNPSPTVRIQASAMITDSQHRGPNLWAAQFDQADGSVFQLTIGWLMEWMPCCSVRLQGPGGGADMELFTGRATTWIGSAPQPVAFPPYRQEWRLQLDAFVAAIATGRPHGATVHDGWRALRLAKLAEHAARTGQPAQLASLEDEAVAR